MPKRTPDDPELPTDTEPEPDGGCAFVLDGEAHVKAGQTRCGAPCRPGSVYCDAHHALCYLLIASPAEKRKLKEIQALADAVGGRSGRPSRRPPRRFLQRMDRVSRAASRPIRSRIVLNDGDNCGRNP